MSRLLMPRATTVWLVDNTTLTFKQIADFTKLHPLEVQAIADGEVGSNIQPIDPIAGEVVTKEEIDRCQNDATASLKISESNMPEITRRKKGPRYTPIAKRSAKPNAIAWLIKHHPEIKDSQISNLIGTTKGTITKVRDDADYRSAKANNPESPVELALCSKNELDGLVATLKVPV